jgi:hypothetical protein
MKKVLYSTLVSLALAVSGQAATLIFGAVMTGAAERPTPVATNATGSATLTIDDVTGVWSLAGSYVGLTSASTLAHIHGPAGVEAAASPIFNLNHSAAVSGTVSGASNPPTLPVYTPAQITDLKNGLHYVNVHSVNFGGGEIRGQLFQIPEPAAFGLGLLGVLMILRRRVE